MTNFEREYYESAIFWERDAVQDENNLTRIRETAAMIPVDAVSLADIGCGNGVFVNYLQRERVDLNLFAIDRSQAALEFVRTAKNVGDIADIPLPDRSYDCISCLEVIEHLPVKAFDKSLSELARVAKKYIIVSVPFAERLEAGHTQCPQCRSIFNADLHFRSFFDATVRDLLIPYNFRNISIVKTGKQESFIGHYRFERTFYPKHFCQWRSPICPLCGYQDRAAGDHGTDNIGQAQVRSKQRRSLMSYFTALPKLFWPKETKYYWIIGLYERIET